MYERIIANDRRATKLHTRRRNKLYATQYLMSKKRKKKKKKLKLVPIQSCRKKKKKKKKKKKTIKINL